MNTPAESPPYPEQLREELELAREEIAFLRRRVESSEAQRIDMFHRWQRLRRNPLVRAADAVERFALRASRLLAPRR